MNIIYFTTAQNDSDYKHFQSLWSKDINPSNQTFHNKLIRCLAIKNHVEVISVRPFSKQSCKSKGLPKKKKIDGNITWDYLSIPYLKEFKYPHCNIQVKAILSKIKDALIITDTINPTVLTLATSYAKRSKKKIIGVCTDSPSNITGTTRRYTLYCLKHSKQLDGYITLTSELNELYNEKKKNSLVIEGIVENETPTSKATSYGNYIFYAGTLLPKYGIYDLIKAYNLMPECKHKLVIAGHSGNTQELFKEINGNTNIIFLGNIPNSEVLSLEASSWANINPRPYTEDLDRYSIPSKVIEYLNSGAPVISVKNTKLQKLFYDSVIWSKSSSPVDLSNSIILLDSLNDDDYKRLGKKAKEVAQQYYSLESLSDKLESFLYLFREKRN